MVSSTTPLRHLTLDETGQGTSNARVKQVERRVYTSIIAEKGKDEQECRQGVAWSDQ